MSAQITRLQANAVADAQNIEALLDQRRAIFMASLSRRPGALSRYFALLELQRKLWNWGSHRYLAHGDDLALRQAGFLASRVACQKLAALPANTMPPSGMRDYWDRLLSLAVCDAEAVALQTRRLPWSDHEDENYPARLNMLLGVVLSGDDMSQAEPETLPSMKDLYAGALIGLRGVAKREGERVRSGLNLMGKAGRIPSRSLAWVRSRDKLCPAGIGIAHVAYDRLGDAFDTPPAASVAWWHPTLRVTLTESEQTSLLRNLDELTRLE